jgi:DNA sulfur modification protein DndE
MSFNRLYVGEEVDQRLRLLKARTGLTPNLLCRLGFCLSLTEPIVPDPELYAEGQAREFNRYTLTGQWDMFFFAMLKERRFTLDSSDPEANLEANFKSHLSRGINMLYQRLESLEDLANIIEVAQQRMKDKYPDLEMEALNA